MLRLLRLLYRQGFCLSILSLCLLSLLLWRSSVTRHLTTPVPPSNPIRGGTPVNNHFRSLEAVMDEVAIATQILDKNAAMKGIEPVDYSPEGQLADEAIESIERNRAVNSAMSGTKENIVASMRPALSLVRESVVEKERVPAGVVWRAKGVVADSETQRLQQMFPLSSSDFSFPNPQITLSLEEIERSQWVASLRRHLASLAGQKVINLVSSNSQYQDVLLNWLISAVVRSRLDLKSILVISMDLPLHMRLTNRGIPTVFVPLYRLIRRDTNFTKPFDRVMMLRLSVMSLISHWGFDVHNYDTDAVLLRDPQPLYDHFPAVDIIGSVGKIPTNLWEKWNVTICIGVVIFRASPLVHEYWQAVSKACTSSLDDQEKLNCGLDALDIIWDNARDNQNTTVISGRCKNGLEVRILPFGDICRLATCDPAQRDSYYIWHKGGSRTRKEKLRGARDGRTWFLRYQWSQIGNQLRGSEWLSSIAYWQVTHS